MLRRPPTQIQLTPEDLHEYEDMKEQQKAALKSRTSIGLDQNTSFNSTPSVVRKQHQSKDERMGISAFDRQ